MEIYLMWIVAFILTLILTILFTVAFIKIKGNLFEDIRGGIPKAVGIAPFIVMLLFFPAPYNYLIAIIGITAFIDDIIGRKRLGSYIEVGQFFRGIGILIVMIYGYFIMGPVAILVALMVQILNIADMQPGSACISVIVISLLSAVALIFMGSASYYIPVLLLLITLGYVSQDYSGYIMMGEIGNHSFGVALGICLALVSAAFTKIVAPAAFYPVEFLVMLILFMITAILIAKLREETLKYYLENYLNIQNPTFGDYVMDVLTGGGLGDLIRTLVFNRNEHYHVENEILIKLGARRLLYNPVRKSKKAKKASLTKKTSLGYDEEGFIK